MMVKKKKSISQVLLLNPFLGRDLRAGLEINTVGSCVGCSGFNPSGAQTITELTQLHEKIGKLQLVMNAG